MSKQLLTRIAFAAIAIPVAVGVLWLGGWGLALAIAALGVLGVRELYDLAHKHGIAALAWWGFGGAVAVPLVVMLEWWSAAPYLAIGWVLAVLVAAMFARGPKGRPLAAVAVTVLGPLYAAAPLAFLIAIRHGANAGARPFAYFCLTVFPLVLTWICDTAAYGAGTQFGGPKLAPVLSPNKTWAGAWGGLAGALVAAVLLGVLVLNRIGWHFSVLQLLAIGALVGVLAQLGDVAESLLKREASVKDSSALLPGHGGVLDRLDSLYFVIPASAALYTLFGVL